ncbi:MAG: hypothetical protein JWO86_8684, partial [Myxococcaceae bacterium]|nr:hypothetical protein [Myxococcaceae bacterium]
MESHAAGTPPRWRRQPPPKGGTLRRVSSSKVFSPHAARAACGVAQSLHRRVERECRSDDRPDLWRCERRGCQARCEHGSERECARGDERGGDERRAQVHLASESQWRALASDRHRSPRVPTTSPGRQFDRYPLAVSERDHSVWVSSFELEVRRVFDLQQAARHRTMRMYGRASPGSPGQSLHAAALRRARHENGLNRVFDVDAFSSASVRRAPSRAVGRSCGRLVACCARFARERSREVIATATTRRR